MKLPGLIFDGSRLDLVGSDGHRLTSIAQQYCELFVERRDTGPRVNDPNDRDGFIDRKRRLSEYICRDDRLIVGNDTAGIDEPESLCLPVDISKHPVAGNTRLIADD